MAAMINYRIPLKYIRLDISFHVIMCHLLMILYRRMMICGLQILWNVKRQNGGWIKSVCSSGYGGNN